MLKAVALLSHMQPDWGKRTLRADELAFTRTKRCVASVVFQLVSDSPEA